jgi:hypothetical protein
LVVEIFILEVRIIKKPLAGADFVVTKFSDIESKILPFFDFFTLQGIKVLDYEDFKRVAAIIKTQNHLTVDGLEQIRKIKSGMNRGRG